MIAVRYADDVALGFQHEEEARKYTTELGERLSRFGLMLHADKTRLLRFGKQAEQQRKRRGEGKPETFRLSGIHSHLWERQKGSVCSCCVERKGRGREPNSVR
jgi:RNA-directed DNA polymerase